MANDGAIPLAFPAGRGRVELRGCEATLLEEGPRGVFSLFGVHAAGPSFIEPAPGLTCVDSAFPWRPKDQSPVVDVH